MCSHGCTEGYAGSFPEGAHKAGLILSIMCPKALLPPCTPHQNSVHRRWKMSMVSAVQKVRLGLAITYGRYICICKWHLVFILRHGSIHFPLFSFAKSP